MTRSSALRSTRCLWLAAVLYALLVSTRLAPTDDAFSLVAKQMMKTAKPPSEADIAALETSGLQRRVDSMRQLTGTWLLSSPKENAPKGLMSGDIPRMLLNLYAGDIGRMLSMEVMTEPKLLIAPDGRTSTETRLRWGRQEDDVMLQGSLEVIAPNLLREKPKLTRSKALKLTWPAMQKPRVMNITYFDGNLLILRDHRGIVDVLRREEPLRDHAEMQPQWNEGQNLHGKLQQSRIDDSERRSVWDDNTMPSSKGGAGTKRVTSPTEQVHGLLEEVQTLSTSLEALRNQTTEDQQARKHLAKEIVRLEKDLDAATNNARADSVILKALEKVNDKVSGIFDAQTLKAQEKTRTYEEMQSEKDGLTARAADMEENITRLLVREGTLLKEIGALQLERAAGEGFHRAMRQVKGELKTVRQELSASMKEVARLREEARSRSFAVERAQKTASNEVKARLKIEEELLDQKRGRSEAQERLSQAAQVEKELREELANLRSEFETLQQREVRAREIAAGMEAEIDTLLKEAKMAQKTLQQSGLDKKKRGRGFWPFR